MIEVTKNVRVLLVEDNLEQADLLRKFLMEFAHDVRHIKNGSEVFEQLEKEVFHLVLIDHHLPGMQGLAVIDEMARRNMLNIPTIIMVEPGKEPIVAEAIKKGAFSFLLKSGSYWLYIAGIAKRALEWSAKIEAVGKVKNGRLWIVDPLTNIYTHHVFKNFVEKETKRSQRYSRKYLIIVLDIRGFKNINSSYGQETGDKILKRLAIELSKSVRGADLVTRHLGGDENFGGDEFLFLLETDEGILPKVTERLMIAVKSVSESIRLPLALKADIGHGSILEDMKDPLLHAVESLARAKGQSGEV